MRLPGPLAPARLVRRYKRFLADAVLEDGGEKVVAHVANPGSMLGVAVENGRIWLSANDDPRRKLKWTWELAEIDGGLVAVSTQNPNRIAEEAIEAGIIPEFTGYDSLRREVPYGANSRIDLLLSGGRRARPAYVEVKNVHLRRGGDLAEFPDCVTARGSKHLAELANLARGGERAALLLVVQRGDCRRFAPAADIDPAWADALFEAERAGVEILCYDCEVTTSEVRLRRPLPVEMGPLR